MDHDEDQTAIVISKPDYPNAYITKQEYISPGVSVRYLMDEYEVPHRWKLVIILEDDTNKTNVYDAFDEIEKIREKLIKSQGSDLSEINDRVLIELMSFRNKGFTIGDMAKILNYRCLGYACMAYQERETHEYPSLGLYDLSNLLAAFGSDEEYISQLLEAAYNSFDDNRSPWKLNDGPFDKAKVRGKYRYFQERINNGSISIKENPNIEYYSSMKELSLIDLGYYERVNQLLQKDRYYWRKISQWINRYTNSIREAIKKYNQIQ